MELDTLATATLAARYIIWLAADVVAFAILVLAFVRWRPGFLRGRTIQDAMNQALQAREDQIRVQLQAAERSREEAARIRAESERDIAQARSEADTIVARAADTSQAIQSDIEKRAREEYDRIVGQARSEIQFERERAEMALRRRAADIVVDAAGEIVKRNLDQRADRRIIDSSLVDLRDLQ